MERLAAFRLDNGFSNVAIGNLLHSLSMKKSSKSRHRARPTSPRKRGATRRRWSARVTKSSNALDLEPKIFQSTNPRRIALSLKRSAQISKRRKGTPYQSAMSMLTFYINRAGRALPKNRKRVLERSKDELREVFGRI